MSVTRREVLAGGLGVLGGLVLPRGCGEPKREGPRWGFITDMHIRDHYDGRIYQKLLEMMRYYGCEWIIVGGRCRERCAQA